MPVADHEVKDRNKIGADFRYGCNNRPAFKPHYYAPERAYYAHGTFKPGQVKVAYTMSRSCQFDMSDTDPGCRGCKHRIKK